MFQSFVANTMERRRLSAERHRLMEMQKTLFLQLARSFSAKDEESNAWKQYFMCIFHYDCMDPSILKAIGLPYPATDVASDHWRKETVHLIRRVSSWMQELHSYSSACPGVIMGNAHKVLLPGIAFLVFRRE